MFKPTKFDDREIADEFEKNKADLFEYGTKRREDSQWSNAICVGVSSKKNVYQNGPCHGFMSGDYFKGRRILLSTTQHKQTYASASRVVEEHALPFYDYLANRSAYRGFILNKDAKEIYDVGIAFRTDVPSNLLVQMLIASRLPTEFAPRTETFYQLTKMGCPEDAALFLTYTYKFKDSKDGLTLLDDPFISGHAPMASNITVKEANNFVKGRVTNANHLYCDKCEYSYPNSIFRVFSDNGDTFKTKSSTLAEKFKKGAVKPEGLNPWQAIQDRLEAAEVKKVGNSFHIPTANVNAFFSEVHASIAAE